MDYKKMFIGQKVKYNGHWGEFTGIVKHVFPPYPEDEFPQAFATVEVDKLPERWPYMGNDFAPSVDELEAV